MLLGVPRGRCWGISPGFRHEPGLITPNEPGLMAHEALAARGGEEPGLMPATGPGFCPNRDLCQLLATFTVSESPLAVLTIIYLRGLLISERTAK